MPSQRYRGFLFQATYRIEGGVPVIHISGRLEDGRSFLIRESREIPHFYVRDKDVGHPALRTLNIVATDSNTMDGYAAAKVILDLPSDMLPIRDRLHAENVPTYEADLRFPVAFLMRKNIRGGIEIEGTPQFDHLNTDLVFSEPEVFPAQVGFAPKVLSFDIETDPEANQLLAIAMYSPDIDEVFIVDSQNRNMPEKASGFASEKDAIEAFMQRVKELDPDVLTGWNVIDFDLAVLSRIARRNRLRLALGRSDSEVQIRDGRGFFASSQAVIHGRLVLDGIGLVRGAFIPFKDHSLDAVAMEVLGEGKAVEGDVRDRAGEIMNRYRQDLDGFAYYARTDARLAYQIVDRLNLTPLAVKRSQLTGMTMDRVSASVASFDFVYISQLEKLKIRAPSVRTENPHYRERHSGGLVLQPTPGMYSNVWSFDYMSLYPSIIRTFNIDPLGYITDGSTENAIKTTNDIYFRREPAILPSILDELFEARQQAKERGDGVASQAIKILMNSFYGVLATPVCRFHDSRLANSVTSFGRHFLRYAKEWFEDKGFTVLYGDTDSVFVQSNVESSDTAYSAGEVLVRKFNADLSSYIQDEWGVENKLSLEYENLYTNFLLPAMRHSRTGARKRYAGRVYSSGEVEFTGLEVVRQDWTELAQDVQRELFRLLFAGEPVDEYLKNYVKALRSGELDEKLVYRKGLRKPLSKYTKITPPHVVAGRKMSQPGRIIEYVITEDGPEPLEKLEHVPDREHYVQKQIRPVAEPVLKALGLNFDSVTEKYFQPDLLDALEDSSSAHASPHN